MFNEGDRVSVSLHIHVPGEPLTAKFCRPYAIDKNVSDVYVHQIGEKKENMSCGHAVGLSQNVEGLSQNLY